MTTSRSIQRQQQRHGQSPSRPPTWLELDVRNSLHTKKKQKSNKKASSASLLVKKITRLRARNSDDINKSKDKEQENGEDEGQLKQNSAINITTEYSTSEGERLMKTGSAIDVRNSIPSTHSNKSTASLLVQKITNSFRSKRRRNVNKKSKDKHQENGKGQGVNITTEYPTSKEEEKVVKTWLELDVRNSLHKSKKPRSNKSNKSNESSATRLLVKKIYNFRRRDVNNKSRLRRDVRKQRRDVRRQRRDRDRDVNNNKSKDNKEQEQENGKDIERQLKQNSTENIITTELYPKTKEKKIMNREDKRHLKNLITEKKKSTENISLSDGDRRMLSKLKITPEALDRIRSKVKPIIKHPPLPLTITIMCDNSNSAIEKEPTCSINSTSTKETMPLSRDKIQEQEQEKIEHTSENQQKNKVGENTNSNVRRISLLGSSSDSLGYIHPQSLLDDNNFEHINDTSENRQKNKVGGKTNSNGRQNSPLGSSSNSLGYIHPQSLLDDNNLEHINDDEEATRLNFFMSMNDSQRSAAIKFLKTLRRNTDSNEKSTKTPNNPRHNQQKQPDMNDNQRSRYTAKMLMAMAIKKIKSLRRNTHSNENNTKKPNNPRRNQQKQPDMKDNQRSRSNENNTKKPKNPRRNQQKQPARNHRPNISMMAPPGSLKSAATCTTTNIDSSNKGNKKDIFEPQNDTKRKKISSTDTVRSLRNEKRTQQEEAANAQHKSDVYNKAENRDDAALKDNKEKTYNAPCVPSITTKSRSSPAPQSRFRCSENNKQVNTPTPRGNRRRLRDVSGLAYKPPLTPSSKTMGDSPYQLQQQQQQQRRSLDVSGLAHKSPAIPSSKSTGNSHHQRQRQQQQQRRSLDVSGVAYKPPLTPSSKSTGNSHHQRQRRQQQQQQ
jgi:hypothetical protein